MWRVEFRFFRIFAFSAECACVARMVRDGSGKWARDRSAGLRRAALSTEPAACGQLWPQLYYAPLLEDSTVEER